MEVIIFISYFTNFKFKFLNEDFFFRNGVHVKFSLRYKKMTLINANDAREFFSVVVSRAREIVAMSFYEGYFRRVIIVPEVDRPEEGVVF